MEQTYYRWRKEYGGLKVDQARRLKNLEQENAKLKRLVSELSLEKLVLKDIASGNFQALNDSAVRSSMRVPHMDDRAAGVPCGEAATRHAALPTDATR